MSRKPGAIHSLVDESPHEGLSVFIKGIGDLLERPPLEEQGFSSISKKFGWLVEIAGLAALRLIQARNPAALDEPVLAILSKLAHAHIYDERDTQELEAKLRQIVPTWPALDHKLFWHDVAVARRGRVHFEPVTHVCQLLGFRPFWSLNKENFSLFCDEIASLTDQQDQLMALSMVFSIYTEHGKPSSWITLMRQASEYHVGLSSYLDAFLNPPPREIQEWEVKQAEWGEKAAQQKAEREEHRRSWREGLATELDKLNSVEPGVMTRSHAYLVEQMGQVSRSSSTWGSGDWRSLIAEFGLPVAQAFRDGAVLFWRGYCPELPSEGAAANSTPYQVIFGLVGLAIEAKENLSVFGQMCIADAQNAARYALLELNGFPEWFPWLFALHPQSIQEVVLREVQYELDGQDLELVGTRMLRRLRWGGDWMYESLAAPLVARLEQPVRHIECLQLALSIVQDSLIDDGVLAELASRRVLEEENLEIVPIWYAVWVGSHPSVAIPALATRIELLPSDEERAKFAMLCLMALVGSREASRCRQKYRTVEHVKTLYLLIHTYVRIADDIDRAGKGVYSPGLRDDAQYARDGLLAFIKETPGKEAYQALQDIAKTHPAQTLRPWSAFYAQQKATADSQTPPWQPEKVVEFHEYQESTPTAHRELWNLAVDRLYDLKGDLEEGDSSIAEILLLANQETSIRKFVGNWLRDRAAGRYVIPQEEQLADDKRPDLRVHGAGFDAPVPVELKLADKWTGPQLLERLENQLGGDYLRDLRSCCGIFLLVNHGGKKSWTLSGKKKVSFRALVDELQHHWNSLASNFRGVEDIEVIGIDLTRRGGAAAKTIQKIQGRPAPGN